MRRKQPRPEEVAPGVHRLETGRGLTEANVYLVQSGESWVLVDAAWPQAAPVIRRAAESIFGAGARPAALLLTHFQPDHSGAAGDLARGWQVPIHVHPDELPFARGGYDAQYAHPLDRWVVAPILHLIPKARLEAARERDSLEDVSVAFDPSAGLPGLPEWQCVPTPGHTPGHAAFFRPADRVLICGDAMFTINVNSPIDLIRRRRGLFPPPWITTWSWSLAVESLARLARLEPRVVASGHASPLVLEQHTTSGGEPS
jgi:glyoxylase-like metal-dependent hydrolase (beta-lactamase superfamily II)